MRGGIGLGLVFVTSVALAQLPPVPQPVPPPVPKNPAPEPKNAPGKYDGPKVEKGVVVLMDENVRPLIDAIYANTNGKEPALVVERNDVFAGLEAIRQTGTELHAGKLPNWNFNFAEKPKAENEFRYMRFAWKKPEGDGAILLAFPQNGSWSGKRYVAGSYDLGGSGIRVSETAPKEWTVVTRDVFKDFGALNCSGILFSSTSVGVTCWDLLLLGKTIEDLDMYTETAIGKGKPKEPLIGKPRDEAWEALMGEDRDKASLAFRKFLPVAAEQVIFIREHIPKPITANEELPRRIRGLIVQLGGEDFDARLAAEVELEKIGAKAVSQLKEQLGCDNAEADYRARRILKKLGIVSEDVPLGQLRAARIARLLERANTRDARILLVRLANGDFGPDYPAEAKAAIARLPKK